MNARNSRLLGEGPMPPWLGTTWSSPPSLSASACGPSRTRRKEAVHKRL